MGNTSFRSGTRLTLLGAMAAALATAGCGGGGGSGSAATAQLAFTVNWEQPAASTGASPAPGTEALAFDTPIPPSVNAIRFIFRPAVGSDCCIAVLRGSQAFIDRHIQLASVPAGASTLEVNGYPTDFAPADDVTNLCLTRDGEGTACKADGNTLPSFGSDEIPVDVVAGITNVVNVDVHSLPFLVNLNPGDGETAASNRPKIKFNVVDANFDIDPAIDVNITDGEINTPGEILSADECADNDAQLPNCSTGGALDVRGLRVTAQPTIDLPPGTADLRIQASNTAEPSRSMESNTTFIVPGPVTTTTTTTTTSSSTITTTTEEITTTTLEGGAERFCLTFSVANSVDLVGISYNVGYTATGGDFVGSGETVSCVNLVSPSDTESLASFNDDEENQTLSTAIISAQTFSGPTPLARCEFDQVPPLVLSNFSIQVTEATSPDLSPADATVVVEETQCPL